MSDDYSDGGTNPLEPGKGIKCYLEAGEVVTKVDVGRYREWLKRLSDDIRKRDQS